MRDYLSGFNARVTVPLIEGGLPIIPTPGTVSYTVLDHSGVAINALTDVAVATDTATYSLSLVIPATHNTIAGSKKFERRTILVSFTSLGQNHQFQVQYRITPHLNHSVSTDAVRGFIGVTPQELGDDAIDLTAAYLYVEKDFAPAVLADILAAGDLTELAANEAIRARAVIDLLPSIRQRLTQMESNGVHQFRRAEIGKFDQLEKQAWDRYTQSRAQATGRAEVELDFVVKTLDADPITGG